MVQSVRPSVRPSVRHTFLTMFPSSYHHEISGVIASDKSGVHAKGQGQRSKVKVTEVTTQLNRFRTVTPVWIHIWWWNDAYNLIMLRRGALLFFKVIRQISRSHGSKNRRIWPRLGVLAATKQLNEWYFLSVRPSVRPSVRHTFLTMFPSSYHHEISGVITRDQGKVHAKGQGQRLKVKVTEVTTQLNRFRAVTPVWIHMWWWNDTYSLMLLRKGALLFLKVIRQVSRSHGAKNRRIWPRLGVSGL